MSDLEAKRRNRRESHQMQEGMASLNTADTKHKVVIDNNFNTRNLPSIKNENESPRKEKGINDKEDAEKRNKVDKEGDAVMVVWKDEQNKNNNLGTSPGTGGPGGLVFGLEVNSKTEVAEDPVSPSPRAGGRDAWSERGEAEHPSQLSFNVRGTIERRKKVYMGSKSGHLGRYRHSRERNADNSITQVRNIELQTKISQTSIIIFALVTPFHVYLPCLGAASLAPSRGILHDCEILVNLILKLYCQPKIVLVFSSLIICTELQPTADGADGRREHLPGDHAGGRLPHAPLQVEVSV